MTDDLLAELPELEQTALRLLYGTKLRYAEIAASMQLSVRRVNAVIASGLRHVAQRVEAEWDCSPVHGSRSGS